MLDLTSPSHTSPDELVSKDERWLAVQRIANSQGFCRSPRLREFLLFVSERQLGGHPEQITEANIGRRVYGRKETYDPSEDNIVRVSARQLRVKLREYYESEGILDPWVIEIPKGGYVPHFHRKEPPVLTQRIPEPIRVETPAPLRWTVTLVVALVAVAAGWLLPHRGQKFDLSKQNVAAPNLVTFLFGDSQDPVQVVVSDSAFGLLQHMRGRKITLEEYAKQEYLKPPESIAGNLGAEQAWNAITSRQIVNLGDVGAAERFREALATQGDPSKVRMQSAQNMRARDFRSGNFILLGDAYSDPWAQLFSDEKSDFQFFRKEENSDPILTEVHPATGEPRKYVSGDGIGYARIALVPNLTDTGRVLLIAGDSMESTEAAANFCLDTKSSEALLSALGVSDKGAIPPFEAVVKTYQASGTGLKAELVTVRSHRAEP
jgi:hypothetical protein